MLRAILKTEDLEPHLLLIEDAFDWAFIRPMAQNCQWLCVFAGRPVVLKAQKPFLPSINNFFFLNLFL